MMRSLLPISALLLGSALLVFSGGLNGLVLPVRGAVEGFSSFSLGLLGTGWALGYVIGCLRVPRLVGRVGHIRSFAVMAALAAVSILFSVLLLTPLAWIPLRALSGFCFAGAAMIVESWLNERTGQATRGRVFGLYTMINLAASTAGQLVLMLGAPRDDSFFILGAIFYCLSLVPLAISSSETPKPLTEVHLDLGALWRNSPVAVFGVLMVGISNSTFGTLAAVYAGQVGLLLAGIALFASLPILAGAVAQVPVGWLSDKGDRRVVLTWLAALAVVVDALFIAFVPAGLALNLGLALVYGASIFAMYPVIVAHANDHAAPNAYIQTSGGLLMIYGIGGVVGPLAAGALMGRFGPGGMFVIALCAHVAIVGFTLWRIRRRAAPAESDKRGFQLTVPGRSLTPETVALSASDEEAAAFADAGTPPRPDGDGSAS